MHRPGATPTIADPWSGGGGLRVRLYALVHPRRRRRVHLLRRLNVIKIDVAADSKVSLGKCPELAHLGRADRSGQKSGHLGLPEGSTVGSTAIRIRSARKTGSTHIRVDGTACSEKFNRITPLAAKSALPLLAPQEVSKAGLKGSLKSVPHG